MPKLKLGTLFASLTPVVGRKEITLCDTEWWLALASANEFRSFVV